MDTNTVLVIALVVLVILGTTIIWSRRPGAKKWWLELLGLKAGAEQTDTLPQTRQQTVTDSKRVKQRGTKDVPFGQEAHGSKDIDQEIK